MVYVASAMDELCITQESSRKGRLGRRNMDYDDTREYISRNLHAKRRRRQKLSYRLLTLRAMVPIITNMNKPTMIEDAITYIQELQNNVKLLSDQSLEMEASSEETVKTGSDDFDAAEEVKQCGIVEEVQVTNIDGSKLWIKIILEKKRRRFTRLIGAITYLGLDLTHTNLTTFRPVWR